MLLHRLMVTGRSLSKRGWISSENAASFVRVFIIRPFILDRHVREVFRGPSRYMVVRHKCR